MAARQPLPTTLPAYRRRYNADNSYGKEEDAKIAQGRLLRDARAQVPADEWEAWLVANCGENMLHRRVIFGIDLGAAWEEICNAAGDVDDTDEELIARCRREQSEVHGRWVEKGRCRAPETPAERELVSRYLHMRAYQFAVRHRVGRDKRDGSLADPPRMRALAKRLHKRGLLPAPVRYIKREKKAEEPKLSRAARAWEKAKRYWAAEIAEHGEELARRMWRVNKAGRASNAFAAARANHLQDPKTRLAFNRWNQGGLTPKDAVLQDEAERERLSKLLAEIVEPGHNQGGDRPDPTPAPEKVY